MLKNKQLCKRRPNAPDYLPEKARISSIYQRMIFVLDEAGTEHILSRSDFAMFYEAERNEEFEPDPKNTILVKTLRLLENQASKVYTSFISPKRKPKLKRNYEAYNRLSPNLHFIFNGRMWA